MWIKHGPVTRNFGWPDDQAIDLWLCLKWGLSLGKFADLYTGTGMKRKRGPAPSKKETRRRKEPVAEDEDSSHSEGHSDFENEDNDSFEGFSSDGEEILVNGQETRLNGNQNGETTAKKRGQKAVPTQEELLELEFRSSSFQSNLFKLQVDELLSEVRVKYDKMEKVERVLHQLKDVLTNIPETTEQLVSYFPIWILT